MLPENVTSCFVLEANASPEASNHKLTDELEQMRAGTFSEFVVNACVLSLSNEKQNQDKQYYYHLLRLVHFSNIHLQHAILVQYNCNCSAICSLLVEVTGKFRQFLFVCMVY